MKELFKNIGFQSLLWTHFLGVFNDNLYKTIVALRAVQVTSTTGTGGEYVPLSMALFVAPFLLFSGYSGHLADTLSKRTVLIGVKVFEVFVMALGLAVLVSNRIELMLFM